MPKHKKKDPKKSKKGGKGGKGPKGKQGTGTTPVQAKQSLIGGPGGGTTIIVRPGGGGSMTVAIDGNPAQGVAGGTMELLAAAFSPVDTFTADVVINGTTVLGVYCTEVQAEVTVNNTKKTFSLRINAGSPQWWLGGDSYTPSSTQTKPQWNADLLSALTAGTFKAKIAVAQPGSPPSYDFVTATSVTLVTQ